MNTKGPDFENPTGGDGIDDAKSSKIGLARRRFLAGVSAPTILSVFSPSALGTGMKVCNVSGFASMHHSAEARHLDETDCGGLYSPHQWGNIYHRGSNGIHDRLNAWSLAGLTPVAPDSSIFSSLFSVNSSGETVNQHGVKLSDIVDSYNALFSGGPSGPMWPGAQSTLHEMLLFGGTYEKQAAAAFLNASHGTNNMTWRDSDNHPNVSPQTILDLVQSVPGQTIILPGGGAIVRPSDGDLLMFFRNVNS